MDFYYDNTGGIITDVVLEMMKDHGRVVMCGAIAVYEKDTEEDCGISPESWRATVFKKVRLQRFILPQSFPPEYLAKIPVDLAKWGGEGDARKGGVGSQVPRGARRDAEGVEGRECGEVYYQDCGLDGGVIWCDLNLSHYGPGKKWQSEVDKIINILMTVAP